MAIFIGELQHPYEAPITRRVNLYEVWERATQPGRIRRLSPGREEDITPEETKSDPAAFQYLVTALETKEETGTFRLRRKTNDPFVMGTTINTRAGEIDPQLAPMVFQLAPNPPISQRFLSVAYEKDGKVVIPTIVFYAKS